MEAGAAAVQVATRFTVTRECGLPDEVKQEYFKANEEDIEVNEISPTGYPMPVVIDLPEGLDVDNVKFSYKTTAMEKYKTLEAKKDAGKYVITITNATDAAKTLNDYTVQAGKLLVAIEAVPIATNEKTRESRLFPSMWAYVRRNSVSMAARSFCGTPNTPAMG